MGVFYLEALALGLIYGITYCSFACTPYLAAYIPSSQRNFFSGTGTALMFGLGRTAAYCLLAMVVSVFKGFLDCPLYHDYAPILISLAIIAIGIGIIVGKRPSTCVKTLRFPSGCTHKADIGALLMGVIIGFIPCAPLAVVLLYSVAFLSLPGAVFSAFLFGIGTTLSPVFLFSGGLLGWLTERVYKRAPIYQRWISRVCGVILVLIGLSPLLLRLSYI